MPADSGRASWSALIGLLLLWGAFLATAYFAVLFTLWLFATVDPASPAGASEVLSGIASAMPLLVVLLVLVFASLGRRWARWGAVGLGLGAGSLGLAALIATASPAPETVGMAVAAIAGAVLLALPASRGWFRPRRSREAAAT